MKKLESFLPIFPGFYNTIFEADEELWIPEELENEPFENLIFEYEEREERIARKCTNFVEREIKALKISIEYQKINSPKEYNFENDSIHVVYNYDNNLSKLRNYLIENMDAFNSYIKERYTSRDGFISYYSTDGHEWLMNLENDAHRLGATLDFYLRNEIENPEEEMFNIIDGEDYLECYKKED